MNVTHLKLGIILISALLFSACGGGGGGSSTTQEVSTTTSTSSTTVTSPTTQSISADNLTLMDASPVESVTIVCDDKKIQSDIDGKFKCDTVPMEFYLGELYLGTVSKIPVDNYIYTQDIAGEPRGATAHPTVTKISMLLESLDRDSKLSNGISITQNMIDEFNSQSSSYTSIEDIDLEDLTSILEDTLNTISQQDGIMLSVVTPEDAQINLTSSVAEAPILTYIQRSIGRIR
jgi:hypothetical protein